MSIKLFDLEREKLMIRFDKSISLLICGAAVTSMVPVTAVNAAVAELEVKEGTIYDAKAFVNGMYIYEGYKSEDADSGTYFSTPKGDILIEDVTGVGERYGMNYINFKDDDILFNLATGQAEDESEEDKLFELESRFIRKVLNKADRYEDVDSGNFEIKEKIAVDAFSSIWYEGIAEDNANDREYTIYINDKGDYIDASEILNVVYYDADGNKVKLDTYEDLEDYNEENNDALKIALSKTLMVDSSNIYRAFVLVDKEKMAKFDAETVSQLSQISDERAKLVFLIKHGAATVYTQKLSMERGEKKNGAYLPKKVETYEAYDLVDVLIQFMADQEVHARIIGKNVYVIIPNFDENKITMKKYNMTTIREKVDGKTVSKKAIEVDEDFDGIKNENMKDFSIDTYGNLWVLSKGKVKKAVNGELETVYEVDRSMNKLSVFDDNSMIIWNTDNEIYSVLNKSAEENQESESESDVNSENEETAIQTGWIRNEDGSWSYKNLDGTNATGWIKDNEKWYYLKADGIMATGWIKDGADWYYLNQSGDMRTGWFKDNNGTWYYLFESGKMAYNTTVDGYKLDANGAWVK